MKKCFKCGVFRPLSDFYKHKAMADGHVNKCKECNKSDVKLNREKRSDYYREYDAWRFKNDPSVKERHREYQSTPDGIRSMTEAKAKWINRNPEARAAHVILGNAVKSGRIDKPIVCSKCGKFTPSRTLHAHHHDYAKPLYVTWLCAMCHKKEHKND